MSWNSDFAWFLLAHTKGVGPVTMWDIYRILKRQSLSLSDLFDLLIKQESNLLDYDTRLYRNLANLRKLIDREYEHLYRLYENLQDSGIHIIHPESSFYPQRLKDWVDRRCDLRQNIPPVFYAKGSLNLLSASSSIAIVGSRNVGEEIEKISQGMAQELAKGGFNIISGYAKGVDRAAHRGALQVGGTTTIVLSYGILEFRSEDQLSSSPTDYLILSQFAPQEKWMARRAMIRNYLVCALSDAVLVIASGRKAEYRDGKEVMSGTFHAAETALEMKIPAFVLSPRFFLTPPAGNEDLIKRGCCEILPDSPISQIVTQVKSTELEDIQLSLFA